MRTYFITGRRDSFSSNSSSASASLSTDASCADASECGGVCLVNSACGDAGGSGSIIDNWGRGFIGSTSGSVTFGSGAANDCSLACSACGLVSSGSVTTIAGAVGAGSTDGVSSSITSIADGVAAGISRATNCFFSKRSSGWRGAISSGDDRFSLPSSENSASRDDVGRSRDSVLSRGSGLMKLKFGTVREKPDVWHERATGHS